MQTLIDSLDDIVGTDLLNGSVFHVVAYNFTDEIVAYELIGEEGLAWDSYYGYLHNNGRTSPCRCCGDGANGRRMYPDMVLGYAGVRTIWRTIC